MKRNKENKELQTRREFFKKAAKGALPIVAGVMLAGMPQVMKAVEKAPMGCEGYSCQGKCQFSCVAVCNSSCKGRCHTSCYNESCKGSCVGGCYTGCGNVAKYR